MNIYIKDGVEYTNEEDITSLGSIVCTNANGMLREYQGLSADADKLPKYDSLKTGSSCYMIDTGDLYIYESTSKTWYKQ